MNCKKLQLDWTATGCNWTCSCSSKDSGMVRFRFSGNLMPSRTATGPVGVGLNRSLVGMCHKLLCITSVSPRAPQLSSITTMVVTAGSFPIKAALRCHEGDDLKDSSGCKQQLLTFFRCSLAPYVICCNHDYGDDSGGHPADTDSSCVIH